MYNTFCNPATGTFAWVGAEEGDIVHLPAPINFSKEDFELTRDILVFATANTPIVFIYFGGSICHANTEMVNVRWRFFLFWRQIPPAEKLHLSHCGHCFAQLTLEHSN